MHRVTKVPSSSPAPSPRADGTDPSVWGGAQRRSSAHAPKKMVNVATALWFDCRRLADDTCSWDSKCRRTDGEVVIRLQLLQRDRRSSKYPVPSRPNSVRTQRPRLASLYSTFMRDFPTHGHTHTHTPTLTRTLHNDTHVHTITHTSTLIYTYTHGGSCTHTH